MNARMCVLKIISVSAPVVAVAMWALRGTVERAPGLAMSYIQQRERIDTILPITALEVVLMERTSREPAVCRIRAEDLVAARHALALVGGESLNIVNP